MEEANGLYDRERANAAERLAKQKLEAESKLQRQKQEIEEEQQVQSGDL